MKIKEEEEMTLVSIQAAPNKLMAVFKEKDGHEALPVLLFGLYEAQEEHVTVIRGLVSAPGGMFTAEDNEDFVGYWKQDFQELEEFLEDHDIDEDDDEDDEEEEDDD